MPYKDIEKQRKWDRENKKSYTFRCTKSEQDMKDWLEEHKPYQPYIKNLVREDMNRQK